MRTALGLLLVLLTTPSLAAEPFSCPSAISFTAQVNVQVVPGWKPLPMPERHALAGARLFDGDPADMADLVPDRITPPLTSWKLSPDRHYTFVCIYNGTEVTFAAGVPKSAAMCSVAVKRFTSGQPPRGTYIEASCQ